MNDIKAKLLSFHQQIASDEHHRYKSWEHCFTYFSQEKIDKQVACLHLSFYLASWGMYRGSSFLLWKDYLIHEKVVSHILSLKHLRSIDFSKPCVSEIGEIFELISWVRNWFQQNIKHVNGATRRINVTDTLVTKILLGTLGCVPAYDRFFIDGLRAKGFNHSRLAKRNFQSIVEFYSRNRRDFDSVQKTIQRKSGIYYPSMKLVDMYFWQIGFDANQRGTKKRG